MWPRGHPGQTNSLDKTRPVSNQAKVRKTGVLVFYRSACESLARVCPWLTAGCMGAVERSSHGPVVFPAALSASTRTPLPPSAQYRADTVRAA